MEEKDVVALIFTLRGDVWTNWGFLITVNVATWGWVIQRHGLYSIPEKAIATVGYTLFVFIIIHGMDKAYGELDKAANELAYRYVVNSEKPNTSKIDIVPQGINQLFVEKSPKYCSDIKIEGLALSCNKYSDNFVGAFWGILFGWLFTMALFWFDSFWKKVRKG